MRKYLDKNNHLVLGSGDYGKDEHGEWHCKPPDAPMGSLKDHQVTEHEDGTITVSPSIHLPDIFHGYLRRGVWSLAG